MAEATHDTQVSALRTIALPFAPVGAAAAPMLSRDSSFVPAAKEGVAGPQSAGEMEAAISALYRAPARPSVSNVVNDAAQTLQTFALKDLEPYTKEKAFSTNASADVHLFYVGRDDVHDILKYILSRVSISLYLNMFGFDDSELNNILMTKALDASVTMLITLDRSQAGGVHEKALLAADQQYNLAAYNTHFVIGESATRQISHTKGFVADGRVAAEGSTNWSNSGEGTFVVVGQAGGPNYKAQNNTQSVITDPDTIVRFQTELITEHMTAASQGSQSGSPQLPVAPPPVVPVAPVPPAKKAGTKTTGRKGASQIPPAAKKGRAGG